MNTSKELYCILKDNLVSPDSPRNSITIIKLVFTFMKVQYPDFTTYKQFVMVVCNVTIFNTYRP